MVRENAEQLRAVRWNRKRNGTLLEAHVTQGSHKRVWWECGQGHEWQAPVYSVRMDEAGCPYCAGKRPILGETDLTATHPRIAEMWHKDNPKGPESVTAGSHKKALWQCEKGHQWEAAVNSVALDGCGCPYCAGRKAIPGETDLATLYPEIAASWDAERNGVLTADQVLPSAHDKVWWRCEKDHVWQAMVFSRTRENGSGCPYCTGKKVLAGFNDLATLKPKLANEWYQPLNGTLTPADITPGSNKKVWWKCSDGHVWQAYVYSRTRRRASGCPICAGVVKKKGAVIQAEEILRSSELKHRTKRPVSGNTINLSL